MKRKTIIFTALLAANLSVFPQSFKNTDWPQVTIESKPWTRWWWMGSAVNEKGLTYNLEAMSKAGLGGVEITPIYGVKGQESNYIDYLTPKWMKMLAFTESEAQRLGMSVDMSMGTGWPFGGPEVTIEDAATKSIFQEYKVDGGNKLNEKITVAEENQSKIAYISKVMAYSGDKKQRLDITANVLSDGTLNWTAPKGQNWQVIALFVGKTLQKVKRAAPGGQGYVMNHLDKGSVGRYFDKFDKAFTATNTKYPHTFFNDSYEVYGGNWTPAFLEEFESRRGYKLQDYFPEFLENGATETSARIVSDYRETIADILKVNFTDQWKQWANQRGVSIRNQAHGSPANLIDLYASVDIPECETFGITDFDIPGLRKDSIRKENDGDPTALKYASSGAHLAGKKYTSAETFTWLTEHFRTSLSQCKPEIDQMFVSGVNHVYFHGSTYSPEEAAWPGWKFYAAVDMSPTNSIWRDAPAFFQYVTRAQSFLQEGTPDNDFLLYFPIYDVWEEQQDRQFLTFAIHGMRERLPQFYEIVASVRNNGYDLDYISDHFINTTTVENGLLKTEGGTTYKALILPSVKMIPLETLTKIEKLAEQGATIVFAGQYPADVPGFANLEQRRSEYKNQINKFPSVSSFASVQKAKLGKGTVVTGTDYEDLLSACNVSKEPFKSEFGGDYIRRKNADGHHYFFAMLQNKPIDKWVPIAVGAKSAMFFDPMTGLSGKAAIRQNNGTTEVYMQLKPGQSIILKTFDNEDVNAPAWNYFEETGSETPLTKGWTMDFVKSEPEVKESFNLTALGSWTELSNPILKNNMATARYKITFDQKKKAGNEYRLSLGDVRESARIFINGQEVSTLFAVPFECNIGSYLKNGKNTLEVEVTNLPANRISDYDSRGVNWRIFNEINFVSITYNDVRFDTWQPVPSGLLGPVVIKEIKNSKP